MGMDPGVHVLKQRTERATFTDEGHAALAAQHPGLAADSPAIPKTICVGLDCAEQVEGRDFSLMPVDRGACLLYSYRTNRLFVLGTVRLFVRGDPNIALVYIIVLVHADSSAGISDVYFDQGHFDTWREGGQIEREREIAKKNS